MVATVNGKKIIKKDLDTYIQYREAVTQKKIDNPLAILHEYINRELLYQEALKNKADKDDKLNYMLKQQKYDLYIQSMLAKTDVAKPVDDADTKDL